ncbi:hypothetical protein ACR77J_14505 [Tissierella praeacuta]|uniref:hypothetical protein n=1 Tax=Tissierella praeacuta TaxID=43131 RepID=UPI003DA3371B
MTSGIRIGTPAMTTRGMKEEDMMEIAEIITLALDESNDRDAIKARVSKLCDKYPLY